MEDRKCPHLQVHYRSNRNFNPVTGFPEPIPDGWYCDWCDQSFYPVESAPQKIGWSTSSWAKTSMEG